MYLSVWTRPDIAERCSRLAQFAHNPGAEHHSSVRHVLAYLKGTIDLGIMFSSSATPGIEIHSLNFQGYTDASFADNSIDRRSTSGYLFKLSNGAVSWKSRKQPVLATSSTEAEYVAYSIAAKEAVWLRNLLLQLGHSSPDIQKVIIYGDNKPALALTVNPEHHSRTKHIEVQWHFVREQVKKGIVSLSYLPTGEMPADGLTKPLAGASFLRFITLLGLQSSSTRLSDTSGECSHTSSTTGIKRKRLDTLPKQGGV